MNTKVWAILKDKGYRVVTVAPDDSIASVIDVLVHNKIGAAPVVDEAGALKGIISERDIIHAIPAHGDTVTKLKAADLMSRDVKTCTPEDSLVEIMQVMTHEHIRHVPVVKDGELRGIVSIRDVVKSRLDEMEFEVEELRRYIYQS
jgi:CBS domain-containing protein